MADEKKSVTIRLDEPDLVEWAASQSAAVASIRMAVKICILQYGKDVDLLDAILRAQFGNGENIGNSVRPMSDKNQNASVPKKTISEQIESDNSQNNVGQDVQSYPQSNQQNGNMMGNQQMPTQMPNQMPNQQMNPQMGNQQMSNPQPMMNPQMGNQMMGNPNQQMQGGQGQMSSSLSSLL